MKNLKIGITLGLKDNKESIWTNGIKQNVLMLTRLLKNSSNNYEVTLLNTIEVDWTERPSYLNGIDIRTFKGNFMEMDMIIVMGAQISNDDIKKFKASGNKKVISYKCGNNYVITMENILFKEEDKGVLHQFEDSYDEVWYIPQQDEVNRGYFHTLYRTNSLIVPFIWHNQYLLEALTDIEKGMMNLAFKMAIDEIDQLKQENEKLKELVEDFIEFSIVRALDDEDLEFIYKAREFLTKGKQK